MIQRFQTLLLGLAILALMAMAVVPYIQTADGISLSAHVFSGYAPHAPGAVVLQIMPVIWVLALGMLAFTIGQFKLLQRQLMFSRLCTFAIAGLMVCIYLGLAAWTDGGTIGYGAGYFLPIVALLFNLAAQFFIRKDIRLLKSLDRIR